MRITVYDVLAYLESGMSQAERLKEFPYLTEEDFRALFGVRGGSSKAFSCSYFRMKLRFDLVFRLLRFLLLTPTLYCIQCLALGGGRWGEDSDPRRLIVSRQP
jgi:hypothetical protein